MKWAVIGYNVVFEPRYRELSQVMTAHGISNQLEILNCSPVDFEATLSKACAEFSQIRIEAPFRQELLKNFKKHSMLVDQLGAGDCLIRKGDEWWVDAILYYVFTELFSRYGSLLDISAELLIIGAGATTRWSVAAALRAGFSYINISSKFDDEGMALVAALRKKYFGANFRYVPQDRLVLLPGTNSLMINTTPMVPSNDLLIELSYLNFLRPDGMIWDMVVSPAYTPLVKESEQVGIKCVRGCEVAALADSQWLAWVCKQLISEQELLQAYEKAPN
jgi:shikimate 5-dehydrogenase